MHGFLQMLYAFNVAENVAENVTEQDLSFKSNEGSL